MTVTAWLFVLVSPFAVAVKPATALTARLAFRSAAAGRDSFSLSLPVVPARTETDYAANASDAVPSLTLTAQLPLTSAGQ